MARQSECAGGAGTTRAGRGAECAGERTGQRAGRADGWGGGPAHAADVATAGWRAACGRGGTAAAGASRSLDPRVAAALSAVCAAATSGEYHAVRRRGDGAMAGWQHDESAVESTFPLQRARGAGGEGGYMAGGDCERGQHTD